MIIHTNLSKMKNQILPTCLQGNYRDSLGEFSNTSCGVLGFAAKSVSHLLPGSLRDKKDITSLPEVHMDAESKDLPFSNIQK